MGIRYSGCSCQDALAYADEKGIAVMVHRETVTDIMENPQSPMKDGDENRTCDEMAGGCQTTPHFLPAWTQQSTLKLNMSGSCESQQVL